MDSQQTSWAPPQLPPPALLPAQSVPLHVPLSRQPFWLGSCQATAGQAAFPDHYGAHKSTIHLAPPNSGKVLSQPHTPLCPTPQVPPASFPADQEVQHPLLRTEGFVQNPAPPLPLTFSCGDWRGGCCWASFPTFANLASLEYTDIITHRFGFETMGRSFS